MMRGLLLKSRIESVGPIGVATGAMVVVTAVLTRILPELQQGLSSFLLEMPFMRTMLTAMFSIDLADGLTTRMLLSIIWTHPVVLAITWATAITHGSRMPATEIERGTADVLFGWPVTRMGVLVAESLVGAAGLGIVSLAGIVGYALTAGAVDPAMRPSAAPIVIALVNLAATGLLVLAVAQLASVLSARRSRAVAWTLGFVLASFLMQFVAQFWPAMNWVRFVALTHYYQPARIIGEGAIPWSDLAVLLASAVAIWLVAAAALRRRDLA